MIGSSSGDAGGGLFMSMDEDNNNKIKQISMKRSWQPVQMGLDPRHEC
jgi:hypothetical protein